MSLPGTLLIWLAGLVAVAAAVTYVAADDDEEPAADVAYITGYTFADNTPAWSSAISDPVLHQEAGGQGTYEDPVTIAVTEGVFQPGTRIYLPHVQRYFLVEDTCASCGGKAVWLDMWIGGTDDHSFEVQDECARALTGSFPYEVDPPRDRDVVVGPLLGSDGSCYEPSQEWRDGQ